MNNNRAVLIMSVVIGFAMNLGLVMVHGVAPDGPFWGLAVLCGFAAGALLATLCGAQKLNPHAVDIWGPQSQLMAISAQNQPELPTVDKGVLLYFSLICEEMGELQTTLTRILHKASANSSSHPANMLYSLASLSNLSDAAHTFKNAVAALPDHYVASLSRSDAINLLDDITDVTVTVAGFGLAAGLPVRAAYADVLNSNLSKANPETGLIDKEPSGKWVKGQNYQKPNLGAVLDTQWREHTLRD